MADTFHSMVCAGFFFIMTGFLKANYKPFDHWRMDKINFRRMKFTIAIFDRWHPSSLDRQLTEMYTLFPL